MGKQIFYYISVSVCVRCLCFSAFFVLFCHFCHEETRLSHSCISMSTYCHRAINSHLQTRENVWLRSYTYMMSQGSISQIIELCSCCTYLLLRTSCNDCISYESTKRTEWIKKLRFDWKDYGCGVIGQASLCICHCVRFGTFIEIILRKLFFTNFFELLIVETGGNIPSNHLHLLSNCQVLS